MTVWVDGCPTSPRTLPQHVPGVLSGPWPHKDRKWRTWGPLPLTLYLHSVLDFGHRMCRPLPDAYYCWHVMEKFSAIWLCIVWVMAECMKRAFEIVLAIYTSTDSDADLKRSVHVINSWMSPKPPTYIFAAVFSSGLSAIVFSTCIACCFCYFKCTLFASKQCTFRTHAWFFP